MIARSKKVRLALPVAAAAVIGLLAASTARAAGAEPGEAPELPAKKSVSQYGIEWTFEKPVPVGQFVNGDWYVVGPATVASISPRPADGRNGSVLNVRINDKIGFDSRLRQGRWDGEQFRAPPIDLKPGDSLVSTISADPGTHPRMMRPSSKVPHPVLTAAVLTCLDKPAPKDAFRPSYCDKTNKLYFARNLRRQMLPKLKIPSAAKKGHKGVDALHKIRPASWDQTDISIWTRVFQRPYIDTCFDGFASPIQNMPQYGREYARAAGIGGLLLCCDFTDEQKTPLLINMVQVGIDLWGVALAGHRGWPAHGGHGNGRKFMIVFAGLMLDEKDMMNPYAKCPKLKLSEDMQTMFGKSWTGADVVYAGHVGKDGLKGKTGWGAYEHLHPSKWEDKIGESYRRCCTSHVFVGEALVFRLLRAEKVWNHDAFFAYADRWMTEDDTEHIRIIKAAGMGDYSEGYFRGRSSWDPLVNEMWKAYRHSAGSAPTGGPSSQTPNP